jgi:hypothetical protein
VWKAYQAAIIKVDFSTLDPTIASKFAWLWIEQKENISMTNKWFKKYSPSNQNRLTPV